MRKILLTTAVFFCCVICFGQIAGPNSGAAFTNVAIAGSNKSWINTGNAASSNNNYATYGSLSGSSPSYSDYLQATDFGFSIPNAVSVTGIVVEVERSDPSQRTADYRIRIVKGGTIGATERSSGAAYSAADGYQTYGNSGDLWGETWTDADINAANFGVAIAAIRTVNGSNAGQVDHIRITVYYDFVILPVKLSDFTAKRNGNAVELKWQTTEESNMNHYEVERTFDGSSFSAIQNINSRNQSISTSYTTSDIQPNKGVNFYRLKMIDNNGKATYSRIAAVQFSSGKNIVLYPNPWVKGTDLNITNMNGDLITVDYYSPGGQLIGTSASAGRTVSTSALLHVKGLVIYKLRNKDGFTTGAGTLQVY
jgi:hypothetical protein